jgi:hypothetical protein
MEIDAEALEKLQRPFRPKDVEFRAQTVTRDGTKALALPFIDSRAVQDRLDDILGPANWQCRYQFSPDGKKTLCEIGVRCDGEWIWKADGAGDSDVEPEKGALSDAFKRAAVKWGIGRYLYDLPALWVPCESRDGNGKKQFVKFTTDPRAILSQASGATEQPTPERAPAAAAPRPPAARPESRGDQAATDHAAVGKGEREGLIAEMQERFTRLHPETKFYPWASEVLGHGAKHPLELAEMQAVVRHLRVEEAVKEGQARQGGTPAPDTSALRQGL